MTITRNTNGSITIATIHNGYREHMTYYGYSVNECKQLFKEYLKSLEKENN